MNTKFKEQTKELDLFSDEEDFDRLLTEDEECAAPSLKEDPAEFIA